MTDTLLRTAPPEGEALRPDDSFVYRRNRRTRAAVATSVQPVENIVEPEDSTQAEKRAQVGFDVLSQRNGIVAKRKAWGDDQLVTLEPAVKWPIVGGIVGASRAPDVAFHNATGAIHVASTGIGLYVGLQVVETPTVGRLVERADEKVLPLIAPVLEPVHRIWMSDRMAPVRSWTDRRLVQPTLSEWSRSRFLLSSGPGRFVTGVGSAVLSTALLPILPFVGPFAPSLVLQLALGQGAFRLAFPPLHERFKILDERHGLVDRARAVARKAWPVVRWPWVQARAALYCGRHQHRSPAGLKVEEAARRMHAFARPPLNLVRAGARRVRAFAAQLFADKGDPLDDSNPFVGNDCLRLRELSLGEAARMTTQIIGPVPELGHPDRKLWWRAARVVKTVARGTPENAWLLEGEKGPDALGQLLGKLSRSAVERGDPPPQFDLRGLGEAVAFYSSAFVNLECDGLVSTPRPACRADDGRPDHAALATRMVGCPPTPRPGQSAGDLTAGERRTIDTWKGVVEVLERAKETSRGLRLAERDRGRLRHLLRGHAVETQVSDAQLDMFEPRTAHAVRRPDDPERFRTVLEEAVHHLHSKRLGADFEPLSDDARLAAARQQEQGEFDAFATRLMNPIEFHDRLDSLRSRRHDRTSAADAAQIDGFLTPAPLSI